VIKNILAYGFCVFNALFFVAFYVEVSNVTPEQAALEGMTQGVYASIAYVDALMVICSVLMAVAIFKNAISLFLAAAWGYFGLYICDIIISTAMALEANDPAFIYAAWIYAAISLTFILWAPKFIKQRLATS